MTDDPDHGQPDVLSDKDIEQKLWNYPFCPGCGEALNQMIFLAEGPWHCDEVDKDFSIEACGDHTPEWAIEQEREKRGF